MPCQIDVVLAKYTSSKHKRNANVPNLIPNVAHVTRGCSMYLEQKSLLYTLPCAVGEVPPVCARVLCLKDDPTADPCDKCTSNDCCCCCKRDEEPPPPPKFRKCPSEWAAERSMGLPLPYTTAGCSSALELLVKYATLVLVNIVLGTAFSTLPAAAEDTGRQQTCDLTTLDKLNVG